MDEDTFGYMCMTDFDHELGAASGGVTVYPSVADLKRRRTCVDQCGIVKVRVEFVETIQESKI